MEGYFNIKVKFVLAVLLAVLLYVSYLYVFKEQSPTSFELSKDCGETQTKEGTVKANEFFERYFEQRLLQNPEWQSRLGRKENNDQWTSLTEANDKAEHSYNQAMLSYLEDSILLELCLDKAAQLNAQLLVRKLKVDIEGYPYRHYDYPINPRNGVHLQIPFLLIHRHKIEHYKDAAAYIDRVQTVPKKINELIAQLKIRAKKNIILPKFLFPEVFNSIESILENKKNKPNLVLTNFDEKVAALAITAAEKDTLRQRLAVAFDEKFVSAYQKLYRYLVGLEKKATDEIGVWRWKTGTDFYAFKLKEQTTTLLTADEIYDLGIEEVSRIKKEMNEVLKQLNYKGNLQEFFKFLRTNPQFYYPNTNEGKVAYLDDVKGILDSMQSKLDQLFITKPERSFTVKALESFRAEFMLKSVYQKSGLGSDKPFIYYVNTNDMKQLPKYTMAALAYHEVIPGHHLQLSIEEALDLLPFRRLEGSYAAYTEGWAMYAAYLSKEIGAYNNAYADFGRLALELWRACCLVVDVGIHHRKWTRQEAIDYYKENTPSQASDCVKMVERHVVLPAEATTYKIGMITILELRKRAELELGAKFDLREFHEVLLTNGKVPLDVLQDLVEAYIQTNKE